MTNNREITDDTLYVEVRYKINKFILQICKITNTGLDKKIKEDK